MSETFVDLFRTMQSRQGRALYHFENNAWQETSYPELCNLVLETAKTLAGRGIVSGDRVALLAQTRAEWTVIDCATLLLGAVLVPLYPTSSPQECHYLLTHSKSKLLLAEDDKALARLSDILRKDDLLDLPAVTIAGPLSSLASRLGDNAITDEELQQCLEAVEANQLATMVYTSGTTNLPKACAISQHNLASLVDILQERMHVGSEATLYAFLPLAHVLTRIVQLYTLAEGATLAYWRHDMTKILDDLEEVRPTHLPAVPRIFEKVYQRVHANVSTKPGLIQKMFAKAQTHSGKGLMGKVYDALFWKKVRQVFGGRLEFAITGAAPIDKSILEFFKTAGVNIHEGYGMTETSGVATLNVPGSWRLGSIGQALPQTKVRIAQDGEIQLSGPQMFQGYEGNQEATDEALLPDGWLATGDLGRVDDEGFVYITGRKKELIINASGKNIAPAAVESLLRNSPWLAQAVVYGDRKPYLVALLFLAAEEKEALALHCNVSVDDVVTSDKVHSLLEEHIKQTNPQLAPPEQVKKFVVLDSMPAELLTPSMKVKRDKVYQAYDEQLNGLYQ